MKLYIFRSVPLSIIRSLFTVHSAMVYVLQVCRQLSSRSICSCSKAVYKPVWHIPLLSVQWINSWWWTEELTEKCRVSWQNKFVKSEHLVRFIIKNFVAMHGHMNVKKYLTSCWILFAPTACPDRLKTKSDVQYTSQRYFSTWAPPNIVYPELQCS